MVQDDIDKLQIKATAGSLMLSGSLNASFTFQNRTQISFFQTNCTNHPLSQPKSVDGKEKLLSR
jgi:hypothetical protein